MGSEEKLTTTISRSCPVGLIVGILLGREPWRLHLEDYFYNILFLLLP